MSQEIIMAFLFGIFFGTVVRAAFESVKFWELLFDCYYWAKYKLEESRWLRRLLP